jgi:hypothetical protein
MIKYLLVLLTIHLISLSCIAQGSSGEQNTGTSEIDKRISNVKTPSSPAALILGNQPSVVNRPKSWEALEVGLYTNYLNNQGNLIIPNDYAIEFSPYWAQNKLKVSNADFLVPSPGLSALQNFSISISSTQNFIIKDSVHSNAIGFGLRTMIWQGSKGETGELMKKYGEMMKGLRLSLVIFDIGNSIDTSVHERSIYIKKLTEGIRSKKDKIFQDKLSALEISRFINELIGFLEQKLPLTVKSKIDFDNLLADLVDEFIKLDTSVKTIEDMRADRKGFKLEVAAGMGLDFPTNTTSFATIPKWGIWVTPSYQPYRQNWIEFLVVLRYTNYNLSFYKNYLPKEPRYNNTVDYGLRVALKWKKFTLEFEGAGRWRQTTISKSTDENGITTTASKSDNDFQYLLNFNYQIQDNLVISYNFGDQFQQILSNNKGTLISLLTLNFGIGAPKKSEIGK